MTETGTYDVTVNGTWEPGGGTGRLLQVFRILGPGPNRGQSVFLEYVGGPPATSGATAQSLTLSTALEKGDTLRVGAASCDADVELDRVSVSMVQQATAE